MTELEEPSSKNVLHFSHSFFLKIADKLLTAEAAIQGIGFGGALAALLYKQPEQVKKALRVPDCNFRESLAKLEKSKLLIICLKFTFGELSSKILFECSGNF